ncbi:GNAT domain-containing protein [Talaromyces proteolyticus]|uniref:GNAT domain-containing protein n=1 Tax=Talaromyces proteolyticus TaxID=1131652 RepID=A0AAD4KJD9_9EURO|nr:GNAT domain-containing protein [Talaromyces proteolyticus]KAH8693706.1 GNAT domain-containing protein [Talaromyces proteolyticus]
MLINATTALSTSSTLLVPYLPHHVPRYHEWMKNEEIQQATASEPLSLEEEYSMQKSWREDADKLTFIVCLALPLASGSGSGSSESEVIRLSDQFDGPERMVGDVNLFLRIDEEEEGDGGKIVGELELMIAERQNQGKGYGRAALLVFLRYIVEHENGIVAEFLRTEKRAAAAAATQTNKLDYLSVKIGQTNIRSVRLFESLGFVRVADEPNYFGEVELRRAGLVKAGVEEMCTRFAVRGYRQLEYRAERES